MIADNINHNGACLQMNTGEQAFSRPCLGSWLLYGLGSEHQSLPGFVVISPAQPAQGAPLWSSSFLPAAYQGTLVSDLKNPIDNLKNSAFTANDQRDELDLLKTLNEKHREQRAEDSRLSARIESFELAFRMQREAPEAFNIENESAATKSLYGVGEPVTDIFARQCLMAARLAERGVRMIQVYHTTTSKRSSCQLWDQHGSLRAELANNCAATDKPTAALLADLEQRGLLRRTLVVVMGEFGRSPKVNGAAGRDHWNHCYGLLLAGGGIKGGYVHGASDKIGARPHADPVLPAEVIATIYECLAIPADLDLQDRLQRPFALVPWGRPIAPLLA